MSSWLNLSGNLTSNISSLTGHISNFTREVLTEGTEEIYDQEAELSIAKAKIRELEARINNQKNEWERINKINEELQERAESAELQIRAMSGEYRVKLDDKESEIKRLKQAQADAINSPIHKSFQDSWIDGDETDSSSQLVSQLQREVADLHADCNYWKDIANSKQNADADLESLQQEHQEKITSLQNSYTQKLNKLKKKYKQDTEELRKERDNVKAELDTMNESNHAAALSKGNEEEINILTSALKKAEEQIKSLEEETGKVGKLLEKANLELRTEKVEYETQLKDKEEMIMSFDDEICRLTKYMEEKDARISVLEEEVSDLKDCLYSQEIDNAKKESVSESTKKEVAESCAQTQTFKDLLGSHLKDMKEIQDNLLHTTDENVSLTLENNKLAEQLELVCNERYALCEEVRNLKELNLELSETVSRAELERDAAATERDRIEDSVKELEELRFEISRLQSWTDELVEDLELSKEVQSEQSFELKSLRHICQLKGEPREEIKQLRSTVQKLADQHVELFKQYRKVSGFLKESENKLLSECTLHHETAAMVSDFGCQVNVNPDINIDTVESLRAEKAILERTIEGLERRAGTLEDMFADIHERKRMSVSRIATQEHKKRLSAQLSSDRTALTGNTSTLSDDPDKPSLPDKEQSSTPGKDRAFSPCSVESQDGSYFDDDQPRKLWGESDPKVTELEGQLVDLVQRIQSYESFVTEMESKERDWSLEKTAMENMIIDLQKRVKQQETVLRTSSDSLNSWIDLDLQNAVHVQNRGIETDLSLMDIDELLQLTTVNRELASEIDTQRKLIIGAEHCLIDVVDKLRLLVDKDTLNEPEFISRINSMGNDKHSNTYKRFEKVTYLVEVLTRNKQAMLDDKEEELRQIVQENEQLTGELASAQQGVEAALEQISTLSSENKSLKEELLNTETKFTSVEENLRQVLNENSQLQNEVDQVKLNANSTGTELEYKIQCLSKDLLSVSKEREQLLLDLSSRDDSLLEQQEKYDSMLERVVEEKDQDLVELQEQQEQVMELYKKQQKDMDLVRSEKQDALEKIARLEGDLASLSANLNDTLKDLKERPTDEELHERDNEIKFLNAGLEKLEREKLHYLESASKQIELLEDQILEHEEQVKKLEIQSLNFESELARKDDELTKSNEKMRLLESSFSDEPSRRKLAPTLLVDKSVSVALDAPCISISTEANQDVRSLHVPSQAERKQVVVEDIQQSCTVDVVDAPPEELHLESAPEVEIELKRLLEDRVAALTEELTQLRLLLDERERTIQRLTREAEQFLKVIRTKDELLLDLQTADLEDANSESRRKIIAYIRELESNSQSLEDKLEAQEEMVGHYNSQLTLMKKDREKLLGENAAKNEKLSELNERLENVEARSQAKEHASAMLHHEHQRMLELNKSQGDEIAKLREKINQLQISLQAKQDHLHQLAGVQAKCSELENEINAFQGEEERLLTLIHEKNSQLLSLEDSLSQASTANVELGALKKKANSLEEQLLSTTVELDETRIQLRILEEEKSCVDPTVSAGNQETQTLKDASVDVGVSCNTSLAPEKGALESIDAALHASQAEVKRLQAELTRLQEEHALAEAAFERTDQLEIEKLRSELLRLRGERQMSDATNSEAKRVEIEVLKTEVSRLEEMLQVNEIKNVQAKEAEIGRLRTEVGKLEKMLQMKENKIIQAKQEEVERLQAELIKTQERLQFNEASHLESRHTEMGNLQGELVRLQGERETIHANYREMKQKLNMFETEKSREISVLHETIKGRNQHILSLQEDLNNANTTLNKMQEQHESVLRQNKSELEQKMKLLVQDFESKLSTKEEEMKECKKQIDLLNSVNDQLKSAGTLEDGNKAKMEVLHVELERVNALYEEQKQEVSHLRTEVSRYKNIVSASEAALDKTQEDNRHLKLALEKANLAHSEVEEDKRKLQRRIQELETDMRRLTVSYREVEAKAAKDMERLRNHLLEIEESYTKDALTSQQHQDELEKVNVSLEEEMERLKRELQELNVTSKRQRSELQEQLMSLSAQRDTLGLQLSASQDQAKQHANAMNNLQRALEQFQRDKDAQQDMMAEESRKELSKALSEVAELKEKEKDYEVRINEAKLAVQGVSNLSRQLEEKDSENDQLKQNILMLESHLQQLEEEMRSARMASENKLDKALLKNLMLGYFHTPENKRAEVIYVIGNLLDFSKDEIEQVGTGAPVVQRGWVSSLLPFGAAKATTSSSSRGPGGGVTGVNKSFAEAFVSFLEEESGANKNISAPRKLASLLLSDPSASSTPIRGPQLWAQPPIAPNASSAELASSLAVSSSSMDPLTAKPATNPLYYSSRPVLFPAPGQEIPKVHTHTANSALKNMLAS